MNEPNPDRIPTMGSEPNQKPRKKGIFPIIIGVIMLAAGVGIGVVLAPRLVVHKGVVEPEVGKTSAAVKEGFGEVYLIEDIIVNPSESRRIFMCSIGLEVANPELVKEVKKREVLLRDNFNTLFSSQTVETLLDIKYRQAFRARVKKIVDLQLGEGVVRRVFFEKWVVQ